MSTKKDMSMIVQQLRFFNEKANELADSTFLQAMLHGQVRFTLSGLQSAEVAVEYSGPKGEMVKAFVLTFRFFIQDNEKSSLGSMAKAYQELASASFIAEDTLQRFVSARKAINAYLDNPSPNPELAFDDRVLTRRDIMDVFVYGGLAHATKKAQYDRWAAHPVAFPSLQMQFSVVLFKVLQTILYIRDLNAQVIDQLES